MSLKKAMLYYLTCLDAVTVDKLSDLLDIKPKQAEKIINFVRDKSPAYGQATCEVFCKDLETIARAQGYPYSLDSPGKWELNVMEVRDILGLCEIRAIDDLQKLVGGKKALAEKLMHGKDKYIMVYANTLKQICDLTGSLPEEIAEKEGGI